MPNQESADYQKGYEDGIMVEQDSVVNAYYDGYRRGFRDARKDRYDNGWYNGLMIGTLGTFICGWVVHITSNQHKVLDVSFGKR
jgi:hypothetical protein